MSDDVKRIGYTHIGGQAVLEGVMMRGKRSWAIAVRTPSGDIHVEEHDLTPPSDNRPWLAKPVIRGVVALVDTLSLAMKAFSISAQYSGETEEDQLSGSEVTLSMVLGVGLAIVIFIIGPALRALWGLSARAARPKNGSRILLPIMPDSVVTHHPGAHGVTVARRIKGRSIHDGVTCRRKLGRLPGRRSVPCLRASAVSLHF
jgi:hypothetical protein